MTNFTIKTHDHFSAKDVKAEGEVRWNQLRAELKRQGHRISSCYGNFGKAIDDTHFIYLHRDGDLVHSLVEPRSGRLVTVSQVLDKPAVEQLKIRTGSTKVKIELAFEHLVSLGYSDLNRTAIVNDHAQRMVGLIGDSTGVIYSVITEGTFSNIYADVTEILYEVKTTHEMINVKRKRKQVEVNGFKVDEDELLAWLKVNATKSAA